MNKNGFAWAACFLLVCAMTFGPGVSVPAQNEDPAVSADQVKSSSPDEAIQPNPGMLRYPDVSATHIVFSYASDLWVVPREGGVATPLASPPGQEMFPRFSPDGKQIAFMGNYDGNKDIYTLSIEGGVPFRVTHHPANEMLCDWTPQNQILFFSNMLAGLSRQEQLYTVAPEGGLPQKLPVPYGADGAIDSTGEWLAYTPFTRDFRTWKRYRGGWASDIWLFNLKNYSSEKITDWEGTDTYPMWYGARVFYLSDAGENHRLNIWMYDTASKERKQITDFSDFDCKFPSVGPGANGEGEIIFQNGSHLYLLNLSTGQSHPVNVFIPGARPKLRPQRIAVNNRIDNWDISSTGKRIVVEARGDIWTLPEKKGPVLNLTRTNGVAERYPVWSPNGQWIAYFSDASGEYELYIRQSDGKDEVQQLTSGGTMYRFGPTWSPDSKKIVFTDKTGAIYMHTIKTHETKFIDKDPWADQPSLSWSHDSSWLAYSKNGDNHLSSIWLYNVEEDKSHQVTSDMFNDNSPTFDHKGDFLFFASNRAFNKLVFSDVAWSYLYTDTDVLMAVPLRKDVKNPYLYESDEETWEKKDESQKEEKKEEKDADKKESDVKDKEDSSKPCSTEVAAATPDVKEKATEEKEPLKIDLDGFEKRAFQLPVSQGDFHHLAVNDSGKLLYVHGGTLSRGTTDIKIFDLSDDKKEEKTVLGDTGGFQISADGKKLAVRKGNNFYIIDAAADQKLENAIGTGDMIAVIDPPSEWRQVFKDSWRMMRDFFYDPNMHGVDWQGMYDHYVKMLDDCQSRKDVNFVINELISELNVGHAYNRSAPDLEDEPSVSVGMLGVDFELHEGAYRVSKIYRGADWDYDARSPLDVLKTDDLKEGDYLLAVNRNPIDVAKDPWAAFIGLADKTVTLTVSDQPKMDDKAHDVVIKLLSNENGLRYRTWIERNRQYVEKKTDGKVGYIYVPDTQADGNNDLFRQYYGQTQKAAVIIDERWNAGGYIPDNMMRMLNRPIINYWARRDGKDWKWPPDGYSGAKCMLINGLSGSGGDAFPAYFRQAGLGKLIGMRTWGGLVGITNYPSLIDGGQVTAPSFGYYETNGTWGIEGHGVDPDIEVVDNPSQMVNGGDPQLDAAINLMMDTIKTHPYTPPQRPAYPNRSGMGIREEDK